MLEIKAIRDWFREDWRVIRQAPTSFVFSIVLAVALTFGILEWHYSGTIEQMRATLSARQSENDMLKEELKGASPQLAAIQARRTKIRDKLLSFYVEGGKLQRREFPRKNGPNNLPTDKSVKQFTDDVTNWESNVSEWLEKNLGVAARERFMDVGAPYFNFTGLPNADVQINRMVSRRRNLETLIETSAYDQ